MAYRSKLLFVFLEFYVYLPRLNVRAGRWQIGNLLETGEALLMEHGLSPTRAPKVNSALLVRERL